MGVDRVSGLELENHVFEYMSETIIRIVKINLRLLSITDMRDLVVI